MNREDKEEIVYSQRNDYDFTNWYSACRLLALLPSLAGWPNGPSLGLQLPSCMGLASMLSLICFTLRATGRCCSVTQLSMLSWFLGSEEFLEFLPF
jgi:hypothetical protein